MEKGTFKLVLDIVGNPFVVDACKTDGSGTSLSTYDWLREERTCRGESWDLILNIPDLPYPNEYICRAVTRWTGSYENPKEDYDIEVSVIDNENVDDEPSGNKSLPPEYRYNPMFK